MRTLLRSASVLACLVGLVLNATDACAIPITVGPGPGAPNGNLDGGTPTNVDRNVTAPLTAPGLYFVTNFDVRILNSGGGREVIPFLAVGSPSTYTVLWVGPSYVPLSNGVHNLTYSPGTQSFNLLATGTIFAGANTTGGPMVDFANGGVVDHQGSPGFPGPVVGQVLTAFSNPGLGRTYLFSITFDVPPIPEPSTFALLGIGAVGLAIRTRRRRRTKGAKIAC